MSGTEKSCFEDADDVLDRKMSVRAQQEIKDIFIMQSSFVCCRGMWIGVCRLFIGHP
ncbi:MAG: hypothetical protein NPIRA02_14280 [Nitrospirales bacterium]|nr:MAG: hypothetical protein NPIRA02_14280 [Nitrospirales bacterium]